MGAARTPRTRRSWRLCGTQHFARTSTFTPSTRRRLSNYPDIDGFLVGGASLKPEICEIVKEIAVAKNTFAMGGA